MRKLVVLLAASVMVFGTFSPADAASKKRFSVSLTPSPSATQPTYNDTSFSLASSRTKNIRTTIRGKVSGARVKGKKVHLYATNVSTPVRQRTYLGSARISSKGYFRKSFTPKNRQAGTYKIEVVKKAGNGLRGKTRTFYIRVYSSPRATASAPANRPADTRRPTPRAPVPTIGAETDAAAAKAGAQPLGTTSYPVPSQALFVSATGSDAGAGTQSAPLRTVGAAIAKAPSGSTVVLRAGSYHESVTLPTNKQLTIQNYPGEKVWLDGSSVVTGFVRSGATWVHSGWTAKFDSSPTYTKGAPDGTEPGWQWINPGYPMAAHPDQVWIGDTKLAQVATRAQVTAGTFFVDYGTNELVLGSDPSGSVVRGSDLGIGLTIVGPGSTIRGIGVRRYATAVPDMGTVRVAAAGVTLENVFVTDNATQGVTGWGANTTLRKVTSKDNGLTGFHAHQSDNYVADRVLSESNNNEHFNVTPVSAGMKLSSSRGVTVADSVFRGNDGSGVWFDVSVYDVRVTGSTIAYNSDDGLIFELSSKLFAANNTITGNVSQSFFALDSNQVQLWNNTIIGSQVPIRVSETNRDAAVRSSAPYGYDKRRPIPDPTVTWETGQIDIKNNIISGVVKGNNWCGMLCVYDHDNKLTAEDMQVDIDGNRYERSDRTTPTAIIRWAQGSRGAVNFTNLATFRATTSQEASGTEIVSP